MRDFLKRLAFFVFGFIGKQQLRHPIGVVRPPLEAMPRMKRSFAQQGEDLVLDRILYRVVNKPLTEGVYIDVGANHPIADSVTYLLYLRGWRGIAIDANPVSRDLFGVFRPRDLFFTVAVADIRKEAVKFYVPIRGQGLPLTSSLVPTGHTESSAIEVEQKTLSDVIRESGLTEADVDVLSIDVEGAELSVLQGLDWLRGKPVVIAVEITDFDVSTADANPVAAYLNDKGYAWIAGCVITQFFVRLDLLPNT